MSCPCGNKAHDYDKLLTGTAQGFIAQPEYYRKVWKNWSDKTHRNHKPPEFMARLRAKIESLKTGELI